MLGTFDLIMNTPPFLYKYRAWDASGHTESLISKGECFFQRHDHLNDPFEFRARQSIPQRRDQQRLLADDLTERAMPSASTNQRRLQKIRLLKEMQNTGPLIIEKPLGVFCLTEDPRNLLMWSHYASNHQGVCVQFDTSKLGKLVKVHYQENLPIVNWASPTNDAKMREQFMTVSITNSIDWAYEHEWRAVQAPGTYTTPISPVTAVIIGARCEHEAKQRIREITSSKKIPTYEARLSDSHYSIEIPGLQ